MINKLKNLIKIGKKSDSYTSDNKKIIKAKFLGKEQQVIALVPYGIFCNVPNDNGVLLFSQNGCEDALFGLQIDIQNIDKLDSKEISFGIPSLKARIWFDANSNINIKCQDVTQDDNLAMFSELKKGFNQLKQDLNTFIATYNSHTQTVSGGVATAPTSTATPSTASIDNAKLSHVKVVKE
jgi:hypothetical protein